MIRRAASMLRLERTRYAVGPGPFKPTPVVRRKRCGVHAMQLVNGFVPVTFAGHLACRIGSPKTSRTRPTGAPRVLTATQDDDLGADSRH